MNLLLAIPLSLRLVALCALGALAGSFVNWAVYGLAWNRRAISPWSPAAVGAPPRRLSDCVPIYGWLGLAREWRQHGAGFWIRPLAVELFAGVGLAVLYLWITEWGTLWHLPWAAPPAPEFLTGNLPLAAHLRFASHAILIALMLAASLVDLDEKTIPDAITVTGTLVALVLALAYPWSLLPANQFIVAGQPYVEFLTLASPQPWPDAMHPLPLTLGLAVALGAWTLWCGGLTRRRWNTRHGWATAVRVFFRRLRRERSTYTIAALWLAGAVVIAVAAGQADLARWAALVSSLVGVAGGGGVIWAVRTIGTAALGREAMGFGDVTLVSMIGAFLGWQACLMVFFLAPFFGLAFAVGNWILHREHEIPYGPFLCLGALAVVLAWPDFWDYAAGIFELGWVVPALIGCCLVLLGLMLSIYRLTLQLFTRPK